jgi:hypothetical protein
MCAVALTLILDFRVILHSISSSLFKAFIFMVLKKLEKESITQRWDNLWRDFWRGVMDL